MEEAKAPANQARFYFDLWQEQRGQSLDLPEQEIADFYVVARAFGNAPLLREWMETHKGRWRQDYKEWVRLLASWGEAEEAWAVYARVIRNPELGAPPAGTNREMLESQYRASPENSHLALSAAQHFAAEGNLPKAEEIILRHAQREDAPEWIIRKAGHILAGRRQFTEAVAMVMRGK
jgi:hypothetical protein